MLERKRCADTESCIGLDSAVAGVGKSPGGGPRVTVSAAPDDYDMSGHGYFGVQSFVSHGGGLEGLEDGEIGIALGDVGAPGPNAGVEDGGVDRRGIIRTRMVVTRSESVAL